MVMNYIDRPHEESSAQKTHDYVMRFLNAASREPVRHFMDLVWTGDMSAAVSADILDKLPPHKRARICEFEEEREGKQLVPVDLNRHEDLVAAHPNGYPVMRRGHPNFEGISRRMGKLLRHDREYPQNIRRSPAGLALLTDLADECGHPGTTLIEGIRQGDKVRYQCLGLDDGYRLKPVFVGATQGQSFKGFDPSRVYGMADLG